MTVTVAKTPKHKTIISLPPYWIYKKTVVSNPLEQLGSIERQVQCEVSLYDKACILAKSSDAEFYIVTPKSKITLPKGSVVLELLSPIKSLQDIGVNTELKWLHPPVAETEYTPSDISALWLNCFTFQEDYPEKEQKGLRRPQLGAVHAIAGHLMADNKETATIVMPTGTGKTETMLSALVYHQCEKVLVIVPSDALRTQLFNKFLRLGCLSDLGVIPEATVRPRVALVKKGIKELGFVKELVDNSNVLIAIPDSLKGFSEEAFQYLVQKCSHLFIDEAHHVAAPTWRKVKEAFKGKPILQFTATPFRRDGQSLEGSIIYNYPLGSAQKDGYFRHIKLAEVEEYDDLLADEAIAKRSLEILQEDIQNGLDHLLLARVSSKERAKQVFQIYERLGSDFNPVMVYSGIGQTKTKDAFNALFSRNSRVIICVDMLGEGFDLPNLKVAALHDHHKSLAITLQFVGRFTRILKDVGDASVIVNISDPKVHNELRDLYAENADWDNLLRRKSEATIDKEVALQKLVDSFKENGNLSSQLSLWNLRPTYSTLIYKTNCEEWQPTLYSSSLAAKYNHWHSVSSTKNILVALVARQEDVKWGKYRGDIKDSTFELLLAYWDKEQQALFLHCSDYNFFNCQNIAAAICGDSIQPVQGEEVFRIFDNIERPIVRNLGASKTGAISFTMYFGSNITDGLDEVEQKTSQLSNITVWGYEEGDIVSKGCSKRKGKIWSITGGTIADWCDWCDKTWQKVSNASITEPEIFNKFLRPVRMTKRPEVVPIALQWGQNIISESEEKIAVFFGEEEFYLHQVNLNVESLEDTGPLLLSFETETLKTIYELKIESDKGFGYEYIHQSGPLVSIRKGKGQKYSFEEYMVRDPIIFDYVDGSFSYNNFLVRVKESPVFFDKDNIIALDWTGIDLNVESQRKERNPKSIQYKMIEYLKEDYEIVIDDDAAGEAADIIAIKQESSSKIRLCLVHCKFALEGRTSGQIKNFYEVCGQAQKCIRWKHNKFDYLVDHVKRRESSWSANNFTRFIKGDLKDLVSLKRAARKSQILLDVIIVQPGLSANIVTEDILQLLGSTELYLKKTANASLKVICSS